MIVEVVLHPRELIPEQLRDRVVLVFDVLRATTTLTTALASGAREVRAFDSIESAASAAATFDGPKLLCGERHTLPPPGFDLGNSPGDYTPDRISGKTIFFATTNGTRAIYAALHSKLATPYAVYAAALVNAASAARAAARTGKDVTLLCSGSDGQFSAEDFYGAGAVIDALHQLGEVTPATDATLAARMAFTAIRNDLPSALRQTHGGKNNIRVGLDKDVEFAARLDVFQIVGTFKGDPATATVLAD